MDNSSKYQGAFNEFSSQLPTYQQFEAGIFALKLQEQVTELAKNPKMGYSAPYFLIKEEGCKQLLKKLSPELDKLIEIYLAASPHLIKEEELYLERVAEFPMCTEAINIVLNNGLKIIKKELNDDRYGTFNREENEIKISPHAKNKHLLHEFNHAFYHLPLCFNPLIEWAIDEQVAQQIQNEELVDLLNEII